MTDCHLHSFPSGTAAGIPERFTDPFRYFPHPLVRKASEEVMRRIDGSEELRRAFAEGKMLGVLLVEIPGHDVAPGIGYLAAFSGSVSGRSHIDGFVPPIFDLLDPDGHFKIHESEITAINRRILSLETSPRLLSLKRELADAQRDRDEEIGLLKAAMAISKRRRDEIRCELSDPSQMPELIRESQFEKAELRRLKLSWEERTGMLEEDISLITGEIEELKTLRSRKSDELQSWIFRQYIVHNTLGEEASILDIFATEGLQPPGGTGDCAAPKLLEYAFRNGLKPVAMGEFWYGESPETAVRTQGHFYPSCTSKCGPLLGFMLRGMDIDAVHAYAPDGDTYFSAKDLKILHEDDCMVAVDKPSGIPSVPGLDGRTSVLETLKESFGELYTVHRLDMDTSGVLLFAKTSKAAIEMQKQFENHTIRKTYLARLSPENPFMPKAGPSLTPGTKGCIELPLSPDYDERPRQKADMSQGKPALTEYEVTAENPDGTIDIIFHPRTGRTHQLRVHSAHILGLARPILGDLLYGGSPSSRLHLHAASITFLHPADGREMTITSDIRSVSAPERKGQS